MKLIDIIENIDNLDEELIIFQEDKDNYNSNVILSVAEEGDNGLKTYNGIKYTYLIEVFLAKEFINDWLKSLNHTPNSNEIAKRLHLYAIQDA